jgi:hypothetical protein
MNANAAIKNYHQLTAEERFKLILAASERGDEVERDRLGRAGGKITFSMPDHSPYALALNELSLLAFIELLDDAGRYFDSFTLSDEYDSSSADDAGNEADEDDQAEEADTKSTTDDGGERPPWLRALDLAFGAGYVLRAKADGWKLFCERLNVPPFLLWKDLPGFDRLRRALDLAEEAAFAPEGFLRWMNDIRPAGAAELTEVYLTASAVADATTEAFRKRVHWWSW